MDRSNDPPLVRVVWNEDRFIDAEILPTEHLDVPFDDVCIYRSVRQVYAWRDACERARDAGEPPPSPNGALTGAQLASLDLLRNRFDELAEALSHWFPRRVRRFLEWTSVDIDWTEQAGYAWVELRGCVNAPFDTQFDEHGVEALTAGLVVASAGEHPRGKRTHDGPPRLPRRLGPNATDEDRAWQQRRQKQPRRPPREPPADIDAARSAFLEAYFEAGSDEARSMHQEVRWWAASHPVPLTPELVDEAYDKVKALVDAHLFFVPFGVLHHETSASRLRRWVSLGAEVDAPSREGGLAHHTALMRHRRAPELFETLLELGADPTRLLDARGRPIPLDPPQQALLQSRLERLKRSDASVPAQPAQPAQPESPPTVSPPRKRVVRRKRGRSSTGSLDQQVRRLARRRSASGVGGLSMGALAAELGVAEDDLDALARMGQPGDEVSPATLDQWIDAGWIELEPDAERQSIGALLDWLIWLRLPARAVVNELLASGGVSELFADDESIDDHMNRTYVQRWFDMD